MTPASLVAGRSAAEIPRPPARRAMEQAGQDEVLNVSFAVKKPRHSPALAPTYPNHACMSKAAAQAFWYLLSFSPEKWHRGPRSQSQRQSAARPAAGQSASPLFLDAASLVLNYERYVENQRGAGMGWGGLGLGFFSIQQAVSTAIRWKCRGSGQPPPSGPARGGGCPSVRPGSAAVSASPARPAPAPAGEPRPAPALPAPQAWPAP